MKRQAHPDQLSFSFTAGREPDKLAQLFVGCGFIANEWLLGNNRTLTAPGDVPYPSRLFRFPLEWVDRERTPDHKSRLLLQHPLLTDHPFVLEVAQRIGFMPIWLDHDEFGRERGMGEWWHACDLAYDGGFRILLETMRFTSVDCAVRAVQLALYGSGLSTKNARHVLEALGVREPEDRSLSAIMGNELSPGCISIGDNGKPLARPKWAINIRGRGVTGAWMMVHGREDGWFTSPKGRHGYSDVAEKTIVARGQASEMARLAA